MPPKRKTATSTSTTTTATAGSSTVNLPPARRRGRPPILRNNEANVSDDQPQPKRQRMTMDDVEASQDLDPQSLSERTNDVNVTSRAQDISNDHTQSDITSDLGQKEPQLPFSHPETATTGPTDEEEDGDFSTGLRKESSESPAKKTRGVVQRRGKGVLPATRSSPRKQPQQQLQARHEHLQEDDTGIGTMNESSLQSSPPPAPGISSSSLPLPSASTLPLPLPPAKRKRGRPPKAATTLSRVATDSQSLPDQTVVTADISERKQTRSTVISIATAASRANEEQVSPPMDGDAVGPVGVVGPSDSGRRGTNPPADDDDSDAPAAIVPSQVVTGPDQTPTALDEIAQQQQQQMPRLPPLGPEHHHHHQAAVSSGIDISAHPHSHPHLQPHAHPSSLYPPSMPYTYAYSHHGAPSGHYPFAHPPPPPPSGHPYSSSASQGGSGMDYSPSFASTVPTTPGGSFTNTYPHHHPHAILDPNAPHGNPFPPPGTSHIGVPSYTQSVYAVPVPIPSPPTLPADLEEHERSEMQLDLSPNASMNGSGKRKVVPIPSNGGKSGGRAGRGDHVACHFCRGRKLKCDGRRPTCGHCSLRNLACAYDDFIRRRGPGKKEKNTKRNQKSPHSTISDAENQNQSRDQNIMLIGPDIADPGGVGVVGAVAGPSNQAEVLVTVPSQAQPQHAQNSLSSIPSSTSAHVQSSTQQQQRRRRRNPTSNIGTASAQSSTSILRFDTAGNNGGDGSSSSAGILSGLKPSAVAYAVETNERLPVNVNVGIPSVGMDYYAYHHHQQHHSQPHMTLSYTPPDQAVGYYATQSHPHTHSTTTDQGPQHAHNHYGYDEAKDEDHDDDEGDEDADGDTDGQGMESQRSQTQQHPAYDPHPHSHPHHAYPPPPWSTEPPGTHARV